MTHTTTALKRHLLAPAVLMLSMPLLGRVLAQVAQDSSTSKYRVLVDSPKKDSNMWLLADLKRFSMVIINALMNHRHEYKTKYHVNLENRLE